MKRDIQVVETDSVLELLLRASQLKLVPRTGWTMRGVADAESVADHSFGVAFISLILADMVDQPIDKIKLLTIALLHDLPENTLSDIPSPATAYLPPGAKRSAEAAVLRALLNPLPDAEKWSRWWREFEDGSSIEGLLVRDADRLDMLIQAHIYEQTTGNCWLEEFWSSSDAASFQFAATQSLYKALIEFRG